MTTISKDDIARLLDACDTMRDRLAVRLLLSCGLRRHELAALTVGSAIGPNGPRAELILHVHKGCANHAKPQTVPLPDGLGIALALYANGRPADSPLLLNRYGRFLTGDGVRRIMVRLPPAVLTAWRFWPWPVNLAGACIMQYRTPVSSYSDQYRRSFAL